MLQEKAKAIKPEAPVMYGLKTLPADPILGLMAAYSQDKRDCKVDLGVGVYKDEVGQTPILPSVGEAQKRLLARQTTKSYVGPAGNAQFNELMVKLLLGQASCVTQQRVAKVQTPGGCGALRVVAELIKVAAPNSTIWVSDPTWANHIPLLGSCGLQIKTYPYYDVSRSRIDFDAMLECVNTMDSGDVLLLHGSCHNPSGADLSFQQWRVLSDTLLNKKIVPFVDVAYQGFGEGIEADVAGLRHMVERLPEVFVAASCSKNFGLYRERVGIAIAVCETQVAVAAAESHMLSIARGIYSMPPDYGAALVAEVLGDSYLTQQWHTEVAQMRDRINGLRLRLTHLMQQKLQNKHFDFVARQHGMFSFLGLNQQQIARLREDYAIYMLYNSRVSIAGLNQRNLDYVCDSIAKVYK